ncbi:WxL domain-containing protein [Enterococcus faecalis]|nr:WxL domain-containing protein [Enterococcus faecalis]
MKQTKWQRLATIGLCSSLVINAFSGVTAVAETVTIESSPTAESSAKEETSASTEASEATTDTSQAEETIKETEEQEEKAETIQEENLLESSGVQAKIMPRAFVWAATGTTNRTTVRLNDVVDYRMKLENVTTDDTNSDIVGPIRIESKLAAGMTRPTSVIIKVGPEEQNVVLGEGSHNANSGGEYFVWTESTRTVTAFINRLHGRTSGNTGYIKTLYFQTRITSGTHNEKKYIDSTIRFNGFGAVNRRNEMTYVDKFAGNLGLKGNLRFYDEDGQVSKEQMSLSMNPILFKSTNSKVEGTLLRYPLTMTNAGNGFYSFNTGMKTVGTSNGGSWLFFSNDIAINFTTATTNRIDKIVLAPPKTTFPDSRIGVMASRAYTSTTSTRSNYDISVYNFNKATGNTWRITNLSPNSGVSTNIMFSDNLVGTTGQFNTGNNGATITYYIYYKKLYENFVNSSGQKIAPPSGFTQGKKTVINSEAYTFKQAGALPDTYTASGKTYKFKGWYKGKTKPSALATTKAPSYRVTYDGNDDLNVVYEETKEKTATIPAVTYKFGFVDEKGALVAPANFNMTTNLTTIMNGTPKQVGTASGVNNGNLKQLTIPSQQLTYTPTVNPAFSGSTNFRVTVPKQYKLPTVKPGTYYTGSSTTYPIATTRFRYVGGVLPDSRLEIDGKEYGLFATTTAHSYQMYRDYWIPDTTKTYFSGALSRVTADGNTPAYYTTDETMYYFLENRRVTENFVDTSGAKITPPTGFTQGKKTAITSAAYTFKQSGTLPDTYKVGTKTYKFKGWYKGKAKPSTLTTTKAPSYLVTYDDNDDLNVVYEEVEAFNFPAETFQFGFVGEDGKLANPADINITYNHTGISFRRPAGVDPSVSYKTIAANQSGTMVGNFKQVIFPATTIERPTTTGWNGDVFSDFSIKLPKYYESLNLYDKTGKIGTNYPLPKLAIISTIAPDNVFTEAGLISNLTLTQREDRSYTPWEINVTIDSSVKYPNIMSRSINSLDESDGNIRYKKIEGPIYYHLTNRKVTETFVDAKGTKITAPTGFTQGNQIPMTSNTFKYTAAKALPATYTAGGKVYTFQGWYKGKTKPSTLNKTTTPTFNATFDGNDDMTAMYQEEVPRASAMLTRTTAETVTSGGNVTWRVTITNPSKAPLTTATIKKSTAWTTGLAAPTSMIVTPVGGTAKTVPVTATTWTNGVSLGIDIPAGKTATVQFTTKATGTAGQVLRASITTSGNYSGVSASATVRVKDNDQEVVTPTTEGFISVPTFDFGQVGVAGSKQQHSLKQAADYYGNGTRNPYVRIKKTQPNWSLTAQLSQPKSATDSLPTATRLLLGAAPVSSFTNYNQPTELKNAVGTTSAISLTANNTATSIIANKQFTGSNVYQLDFTFNNVKLEVPANQGVKGQQYKAAVTWNLVTGP